MSSDDSVVIGTGDPAVDIPAVQAAVDRGGRVLLQGTFDLGDRGGISINNDVEIHGERKGSQYATKIVGGRDAFSSGLYWREDPFDASVPWWFPSEDEPCEIAIKNIHFDNPVFTSIHLLSFTKVEITGNRFTDGRVIDYTPIGFFPVNASVWLGTVGGPYWDASPDLARGTITVSDNCFDGMFREADPKLDPWATPYPDEVWYRGANLGLLVWKTTADITITKNEFSNHSHVHHGALEVNHSYGPVWIRRNEIKRPHGGGGIWVATRAYGWFGHHCPEFGRYHIEDNTIEISGGDWGDGIYVVGRPSDYVADSGIKDNRAHNPVITGNKIQSPFGGIAVVDAVNPIVQNNRVRVKEAAVRFSLE